MYKGKKVSVVLPAYNEAPGIANAVKEFMRIPEVDEVLVVDNNSNDGTGAVAEKAGARKIVETNQGYGYASRRGLVEASGDVVCITEPDGTFIPRDIYKFLSYLDDFDVVFGTRTSRACIWSGSNMGYFLRYGNWAVGKYLEFLHNGPSLTDVGCTFKMISKRAILDIQDMLQVGGSHFSPELMMILIRRGYKCVEIPVNYRPRVGESKITGNRLRAVKLGFRMIGLITAMRFRQISKLSGEMVQNARQVNDEVMIPEKSRIEFVQ